MFQLTNERIDLAIKLREEGLTLKEVGARLGVGSARAGQICQDATRILEERRTDPLAGYQLSQRIVRSVASELRGGFNDTSPDEFRHLIKSKQLFCDGSKVLLHGKILGNVGVKSFMDLCLRLGVAEYAPAAQSTPSDLAIKRAIEVLIKAGYKTPVK